MRSLSLVSFPDCEQHTAKPYGTNTTHHQPDGRLRV